VNGFISAGKEGIRFINENFRTVLKENPVRINVWRRRSENEW